MKSSISSLPRIPDDIIIEILTRLPVKSLVRFCCVSKFWQNLITKNRVFIHSQLQNSVNNLSGFSNVLLLNSDEWPSHCTCHENPDIQPQKLAEEVMRASNNLPEVYRLIFRQGKFTLAGCCNGIICLIKYCINCPSRDEKFVVYLCNPALHQFRALPPGNFQALSYISRTSLCLFFDQVSDDYKVVRITPGCNFWLVDIYSISNNSWKPFSSEIVPPWSQSQYLWERPVVYNGSAYWLGCCIENWRSYILNVLDLFQERIGEIVIPDGVQHPHLDFFQGSLAIIGWISTRKKGLWVMKEDSRTAAGGGGGGGITWTKQLVLPSAITFYKPIRTVGVLFTEKYLMASFEGTVISYDFKNQKVEDQNGVILDGSKRHEYVVADYVPSLFSVIPPPLAEKEFSHT
ncbi:hypothetical protein ACH5RR_012356 [Cinchona calisaya]|uniref:F-box domain-containing protein n=1 Tax=Cinchona calisaya TaxID=153742 RepID=A0ABD3AB51_9GENT